MNAIKSVVKNMSAAQRAELKKSIEFIKNCEYKGTHIKVELEAQLGRRYDSDGCDSCDGDGYIYCDDCNDGQQTCLECDGNWEADTPEESNCEYCDEGYVTCDVCDGDARLDCSDCDGSGNSGSNWSDENCQEFILNNVPQATKDALVFSMFYNDGSVDSEFTFTLPLDKAHHVIYVIEAFNLLAAEIAEDFETYGAGMHIAILNSPDGNYNQYGAGNRYDIDKAENFARSMTPLLPALYFLASATHDSRGLNYRRPQVTLDDKYGCISGSHNVFEYRIFETCYKRPLAIIDYIIVIANTLKFYTDEYVDTSMNIGKLGIKEGQGVDRFYYTSKHLEALERGVELLRPQYKDFAMLKKERSFDIDMPKLKEQEQKRTEEWKAEFAQVKQRRAYERLRIRHNALAKAYSYRAQGQEIDPKAYAKARLIEEVNSPYNNLKGNARQYVQRKAQEFLSENVDYTVTV